MAMMVMNMTEVTTMTMMTPVTTTMPQSGFLHATKDRL